MTRFLRALAHRPSITVATVVLAFAPSPPAAPHAVPTPPVVAVGAFTWPLPGVGAGPPAHGGETGAVARRFLPPPHPYGRGHRGADLVAPAGTTVLAAGDGTVAFAGAVGGRGTVSVEHPDGLRTTYEPVEPAVTVGAAVVRGAVLGTLVAGHRGCGAPACLHWGLRRPAPPGADHRLDYLDPLLLLGLGTVRLLPAGEP